MRRPRADLRARGRAVGRAWLRPRRAGSRRASSVRARVRSMPVARATLTDGRRARIATAFSTSRVGTTARRASRAPGRCRRRRGRRRAGAGRTLGERLRARHRAPGRPPPCPAGRRAARGASVAATRGRSSAPRPAPIQGVPTTTSVEPPPTSTTPTTSGSSSGPARDGAVEREAALVVRRQDPHCEAASARGAPPTSSADAAPCLPVR